MSNGTEQIKELLSAPMEAVIIALGVGIANAQRELDRNAMERQREINEDPLLSEAGLQATWYQIPRAEVELNIAIVLEQEKERGAPSPAKVPRVLKPYALKQIYFQPVNAAYTNQFGYNVQAASKLKVSIAPVPPPAAETAVAPRRSREEVAKIAGEAQPLLQNLPGGARLAVNFNGQTRLWFLLAYELKGEEIRRLALVVVDDDTGQVIKNETAK